MDYLACHSHLAGSLSSAGGVSGAFTLPADVRFQVVRLSRGMQHLGSKLSQLSLNSSCPLHSLDLVIVCRGSSQTPKFSVSSSPSPTTDKATDETLSAKERRKLRNERREELKVAQEPWKDMVENKWLTKPKKAKGWEADADVNQLRSKGMQWWMIQTTRKFENQVAEQLEVVFPEAFPDREFEVLIPTLPTKSRMKDGTVSDARRKIFQGIVLLRCVFDRDVYDLVRRIPRAYDFFGNKAGVSYQPMIMPAPLSHVQMENLFAQMKEGEKEFEQFKEQCRIEAKEEKRKAAEKEVMEALALQLEPGATIRILSGPFTEFTGIVTELFPELNKVKALVTVFGKDTPIVLDTEQVVVTASANESP